MYGYIYKTTNTVSGKLYIGKRKGEFTTKYLGSGKYLKNAINKYGRDNFVVELIEYCETLEIQNEKEKYWINYYIENGFSLYNIAKGGDGGDTFYKLCEKERKSRISKLSKNSYFANLTDEQDSAMRKKAWETRRKNGNDVFSPEYRKKLSDAHKGNKVSEATKEKIRNSLKGSNSPFYGIPRSEEVKAKISAKLKGRKATDEQRKHMSEKAKGELNPFYGKTHTEATKRLIGSYNKERFKNRVWINNGIQNKRVFNTELESYKKLGYVEGRLKWHKV